MTSRELSRYALSSCAAAAMLAGCGGSQPPIGAPGAMPQSRASSGYGYNTLYSFGKRARWPAAKSGFDRSERHALRHDVQRWQVRRRHRLQHEHDRHRKSAV